MSYPHFSNFRSRQCWDILARSGQVRGILSSADYCNPASLIQSNFEGEMTRFFAQMMNFDVALVLTLIFSYEFLPI